MPEAGAMCIEISTRERCVCEFVGMFASRSAISARLIEKQQTHTQTSGERHARALSGVVH